MKPIGDPDDPSMDNDRSQKRSGAKTFLLFVLKFVGTGIFLYWAFSLVDDKEALKENFKLAFSSPLWLACGIACAGFSVIAAAVRWFVLLRAMSMDVSFGYISKLTLIAALFNVASFGTAAGDAMKMISVMRRYPNKKVIITITVMVDHMVGFISAGLIFLCFGWGTGIVQNADITGVREAFWAATAFQVVGIIFIVGMFAISSDKTLEKFRAKVPRLANNKLIKSITNALNVFRTSYRACTLSLLASIVVSLTYFLCFYVGLRTIGEQVSASTVLTVMPIVDVVSSLPITISGLGVRERAFDFMVSELAGIETSSAVSASLIGFLFHVFWGIIGGIYLIFEKSAFAKKSQPNPVS